jgi:hypothetical protein
VLYVFALESALSSRLELCLISNVGVEVQYQPSLLPYTTIPYQQPRYTHKPPHQYAISTPLERISRAFTSQWVAQRKISKRSSGG